jgi:hypothetical protein
MGVRKFRSITEMSDPPPLPPLSAKALQLGFEMMELSNKLSPVPWCAGIKKFRSVEEAWKHREARERSARRMKHHNPEALQ